MFFSNLILTEHPFYDSSDLFIDWLNGDEFGSLNVQCDYIPVCAERRYEAPYCQRHFQLACPRRKTRDAPGVERGRTGKPNK